MLVLGVVAIYTSCHFVRFHHKICSTNDFRQNYIKSSGHISNKWNGFRHSCSIQLPSIGAISGAHLEKLKTDLT